MSANETFSRRLLAATSLGVSGAILLGAGAAAAQQAPAVDGRARSVAADEVVVTASRHATRLQDTPIAVSAISSRTLRNLSITDLFTAGPHLPGVSINGTAGYGNYPLGIRGIASSTSLIGSDDPVGVYIDGVYVGKPSAALADLLDVDHLEVLRGPQGTLYGRNASAGAILVVHKDPGLTPEFSADASYGSFGRWQVDGRAAGPIAGDMLSGSIAVSHTDMDGWGVNTYNDSKVVRREATSAVGALVMQTGALKTVLRADYVDETVHDGLKKLNAIPYNTADPIAADNSLRGNPDTYAFNYPTVYNRTDGGLSLDNELALGGGTELHSITGYRHDLLDGTIDTDGTAANLNTNKSDEQLDQFSETLYATGKSSWGSWTAGVDFYKGLTRLDQLVGAPTIGSSLEIFATNDDTSGAAFAEFTRKFTDAISLTVGGRVSTESKRFEYRGVGVGLLPSFSDTLLNKSWGAFTPSARLSYQPTRAFLGYLSVSTGFKSGGFTALQPLAFKPENVITYEAGAKTTWLDGRLTLDGDVYYSDYSDLQVRIPVSIGVIDTLNAAAATIKGAEFEGAWQATDQLTLTTFVNYTDAQYENYIGPGDIQNRGQYLNRAPKWQGGGTVRYEQPIEIGRLSAELTYSYRSRIFFSAPNLDGLSSPGYGQIDARLAYDSPDGHWTLALLGKNLTDGRHINNVIVFATNLVGSFNEPASYELKLSYKY
jgi:iron complex outermembrane receptor protein